MLLRNGSLFFALQKSHHFFKATLYCLREFFDKDPIIISIVSGSSESRAKADLITDMIPG